MYKSESIAVDPSAEENLSSNLKRANVLLLGLSVLSCCLFFFRPSSISITQGILGLLITWVAFIPSFQYLKDRNPPPIPFIPLVGVYYFLTFGLPNFFEGANVWGYNEISSEALVLALAGISSLVFSQLFFKKVLENRVSPLRLSRSFPLNQLKILSWILLLSHFGAILTPTVSSVPSGTFLGPFGYISYGTFYFLWRQGKLNFLSLALVPTILCAEVVIDFSSGALALIMGKFLFFIILLWYDQNRIPIKLIFFVVIFYWLLNPVKKEFRSLAWETGSQFNASATEKGILFLDLTYKHYFENNEREETDNDNLGRISNPILFSTVIQHTPEIVPYWKGKSLAPLLTKFIPRELWPDKPKENFGNIFGHRYGLIAPTDHKTSVNIPWMIEFYINFGNLGVVVGMGMAGIILALLDLKLNRKEMSFLEVVFGATILMAIIYQDSNFSLMMGSLIQQTIGLYLLFHIFLRLKPSG
jgi:hypothetical protein